MVSITKAKAFLLLSLLIVPLGLEESSHSSELVVFFCRTFAFVLFLSDKCLVYNNNVSKARNTFAGLVVNQLAEPTAAMINVM